MLLSLVWAQESSSPPSPKGPEMKPAVALVARVTGVATFTDFALGEEGRVEPKMKFKQGVTINTGPDGMVILLFSNGSSLTIKPSTTISIEEYLQAPVPESAPALDALDREPTTSKTKLRLLEGDIVGSVKKLNSEEGSTYEIDSPVGTAGIRGTNYEFSVKSEGVQEKRGRFGIAVGNGIFIPLGRDPDVVNGLEEITFTGRVNPNGTVTITSLQANTMSQANATRINLSASTAKQLFELFTGSDFNPLQPGIFGGTIDFIPGPAPPQTPRVTPNQGER
ncbi:MAG: FecR domain-containing protein [Verrucomicrobiota bacterium]